MKIFNKFWVAIIIGSCIFAIAHVPNAHFTEVAFISHLTGGIVYSYAFLKTKEIWMPFGLHFGWNYTQILFGIPMSGTTFYNVLYTTFYSGELLNGGLYGFEGGILSILSRLLLLGILIYIFKFNLAKEDNGKATSTINSKTG